MKNDIKKYLTLGAALAGSVFMVSCDGGDDVTVSGPTTIQFPSTDKAVAPVQLAQFPLTSVTLTFDNPGGACLGSAFSAGDELQVDFDSIAVTSSTDVDGDGFADLSTNGFVAGPVGGGTLSPNQPITGVVSDPSATTWTIANIGTVLSGVTFTPLASDQRSITGTFSTSAPTEVNVNVDAVNTVFTAAVPTTIDTLSGPATGTVGTVSLFEDAVGNPAEIQSLDGLSELETSIGANNYVLSLQVTVGAETCVVNFVLPKTDLPVVNAATILAYVNANAAAFLLTDPLALVTSDAIDEVADTVAARAHLIAAGTVPNVTGSFRQDFDSSVGSVEPVINIE